jgi:hypothetical protein
MFGDVHFGVEAMPSSASQLHSETLVPIHFGVDLGSPHFVIHRGSHGPMTLAGRIGLTVNSIIDTETYGGCGGQDLVPPGGCPTNTSTRTLYQLLNSYGLIATFGVAKHAAILVRLDFTIGYPGLSTGIDFGGVLHLGVYFPLGL